MDTNRIKITFEKSEGITKYLSTGDKEIIAKIEDFIKAEIIAKYPEANDRNKIDSEKNLLYRGLLV